MSRDINRFNGKYLKCVITPNITSTDVLKNSGSLIVYHPSLPYMSNTKVSDTYLFGYDKLDESSLYLINSLQKKLSEAKRINLDENNVDSFEPITFIDTYDYNFGEKTEKGSIFDILEYEFRDFPKNSKLTENRFAVSPWSIDTKNINDQIYSYNSIMNYEYNSDENKINYLFLGNEFIASGYGFKTIEERDNMTWLSNNYRNIFRSIYEIEKINYELFADTYNKVWPMFAKYIKINGGDVSKTIVHIDNHEVSKTGDDVELIDLLMPGREANYKDAEVTNVEVNIDGKDVKNNEIYLPIGSQISTINVKITGNINDCGGIDKVEMEYNYINNSYINVYNKQLITNNISLYTDATINQFEITYSFFYSRENNVNQTYFVKEGEQNLINYINIHIKGTDKYHEKYYPKLLEKGIEISSLGNIIDDHVIKLDPIKVIGVYPIFYHTSSTIILNNQTYNTFDPVVINTYISKTDIENKKYFVSKDSLESTVINNNFFEINVEKNAKYVFMAIPIKYKVWKVEYEDGINHFIHNWSGCLKVYNTNTNNDLENLFNVDGKQIRFFQCNLYTIVMSKGINISGKLKVYVNDSMTNVSQELYFANIIHDVTNDNISNENQIYNYTFDESAVTYIQNNEFNNSYWLTSGYDENNLDFYLYNYFKNFSDNGAN